MALVPTLGGNGGNGMRNLKKIMVPNANINTSNSSASSWPPTLVAILTQNRQALLKLTTTEIIALNNEVTNATSGKAYLECIALAISGKLYTMEAITKMLLHITQLNGISLPAQTAICTVVSY